MADVVLFVLREAVNEEGACAYPEYDQRPKSARLPVPGPRNSLLDDAASQVGGDQTPLGIQDRFTEHDVSEAGLLRKAHERLVLEYPHLSSRMPV